MEGAAGSAAAAPVDAEAATKALATVTPIGREMARALMWLVDECISGVALELQQESRAGTLSLGSKACHAIRDIALPADPALAAAQREGDKSTENVMCPNCGQKTGAARFAPHLQRCMGGGRNAATTRRSSTPNGNGGRNSAEPRDIGSGPGMGRVSSGSKLQRSPTPPVSSAFSAGGAGAIISQKLQKSAEKAAANGTAGKSSGTAGNSKVATAKHQQALAIANAAIRGEKRTASGSPSSRANVKAARTSE